MNFALISMAFAFPACILCQMANMSEADTDDELLAEREAQFYCYKQKVCTPGGPKVCGYDPNTPWLAVFEDLCTLYKANCKKAGRFRLVDQIVCDTKIQYDKENVNETFEYIHVNLTRISTTQATEATTVTTSRHHSGHVKLVL